MKPLLRPLMVLAAGLAVIVLLGVAQRIGWITAGVAGPTAAVQTENEQKDVRYMCPMMCTPPQSEPGRCPVCGMELVPTSSGDGETDKRSIQIEPVARRVANIETSIVEAVPLTRKVRAIGELTYDEGKLKKIAAYVDGRIEELYADYTGVVVEKGDHLALLYSPKLYSGQVELLVARRARDRPKATTSRSRFSDGDLYKSARERLLEWGMTASQIEDLERAGEASSRLLLHAPISGTVIERLAVEGEYVDKGQPIYRLADLSTVWLMLKLFPKDAAAVRYGQEVEARVQSVPGRTFTGRVAFIDPEVDRKTRTVGVRVVVPNEKGLLRIGDYARATVAVPVGRRGEPLEQMYDPELADKWISPRHPHVIESSPGQCRECGIDLVPADRFGFADKPVEQERTLVIPRSAVLSVGDSSVVYVETQPGRFEIRRVVLGPTSGDRIAVLEGLEEGESVADSGAFLIDSQMQLVGNPSLIDPTKAEPRDASGQSPEIEAALAELPPEDRALAERQEICPVTEMPLGSMGVPIKVDVDGEPVFICCEGCREPLLAEPQKHLAKLEENRTEDATEDEPSSTDLPPMGEMTIIGADGETEAGEGGKEVDR